VIHGATARSEAATNRSGERDHDTERTGALRGVRTLFGARFRTTRVIRLRALVLAAVLVLAGCAAPMSQEDPRANPDAGEGVSDVADGSEFNFSDPASDRLGWEDGYWHDEPIDVDQSDGLSDAEIDAYVGRAMARVEAIRHEEFEKTVPVEIISREEYGNRSGGGGNASAGAAVGNFSAWNNQVWEALFVSGESGDSQQSISETRSAAVAGFYSPRDDEIKVITDTPQRPEIDNATLVHELVHALQDQHYGLDNRTYAGQTQDTQLSIDGLIEGDASYVERRYANRCGDGWSCVTSPTAGGTSGGGETSGDGSDGGGGAQPNYGILLTMYQPYSDGPGYVAALHERDGWDAVDRAFRSPPVSTEQTIHVTDETPRPIEFSDAARDGWRLFPEQGINGSDTVGEASIYVMFWYQAYKNEADTVDPRSLFQTSGPYDVYNYDAPPSAGWANDRLFPYRDASGAETDYGYVWVTEWDTERDAREFRNAYLEILSAQDAAQREDGVRVIENGKFADAFRVVRRGDRVVIVNGPTPAAVDDIRPGLAADSG
jgi:hypothetical protein